MLIYYIIEKKEGEKNNNILTKYYFDKHFKFNQNPCLQFLYNDTEGPGGQKMSLYIKQDFYLFILISKQKNKNIVKI